MSLKNLRDKRRERATDEIVGERGDADQRAVRWGDLSNHPLIQLLLGRVQKAQETADAGGGVDLTAVEADIDTLQSDMTTVQTDVAAAQTDATNAGSTASTALADAAAAQTDATQAIGDAAAVQTDLSTNYYTITQLDVTFAGIYTKGETDTYVAGQITGYDSGAASVTSIQALATDTQNFATAFAGLTVTTSGGHIAGFRATAWNDPDGSGGGVLELLGDVIVPGTLATNRLSVGIGANDFINPDFMAPLAPNWVAHATSGGAGAASTISINPAGDPYAWGSFPTLSAYQSDGSTDGFYKFTCRPVQDIAGTLAPGFAVTPGERVSFSARVSAQRCTGSVEIQWYDGAGTSLAVVNDAGDPGAVGGSFSTTSAGPVGSDSNPDLWDLLWVIADAPANSAYYLPVFRKGPSGSGDANSEMLVARPMHCRVHGSAVTPTPYSPPGSTLIDGSAILTGSVTAEKITVASLDALSANLGSITVGAANIEDAAITSAKLAGTIQSDDFVSGNAGWQITKAGAAEFNSLVVRTDQLEANAVTTIFDALDATTTINDGTTQTCVSRAVTGTGTALVFATVNVRTATMGGPNDYRFWIEKDGVRISNYWAGLYNPEYDTYFFYAHAPHNLTLLAVSATFGGTYTLRGQAGYTGSSATVAIVAEDAEITVLQLKK